MNIMSILKDFFDGYILRKKYKLIPAHEGYYQIQALRDINTVFTYFIRRGDLGGYVRDKDCLSHKGKCWIDKDCYITGGVFIEGNAYVRGSIIEGDIRRARNSNISKSLVIKDNVCVYDNIIIYTGNKSYPYDCAYIKDNVRIVASLTIRYPNITIGGDISLEERLDIIFNHLMLSNDEDVLRYRRTWGNQTLLNGRYNRSYIDTENRTPNPEELSYYNYLSNYNSYITDILNRQRQGQNQSQNGIGRPSELPQQLQQSTRSGGNLEWRDSARNLDGGITRRLYEDEFGRSLSNSMGIPNSILPPNEPPQSLELLPPGGLEHSSLSRLIDSMPSKEEIKEATESFKIKEKERLKIKNNLDRVEIE